MKYRTMFLSKCSQKKFNFHTFYRFSYNSVHISDLKAESNPTKNVKSTKEICSYLKLNNAEYLLSKIPSKYFNRNSQSKRYLLINPNVAKQIGEILGSHIKDKNTLEYDPGFGLLTEELVHRSSQLKLYEEDRNFIPNLLKFKEKYGDKVVVLDKNILQFDEVLNSTLQSCGNIEKEKTLIATVLEDNLKKCLPLLMKKAYLELKQFELIFIIDPNTYTRWKASPCDTSRTYYHTLSVLGQLAFDLQLLSKDIPRKAFLPWSKRKKKTVSNKLHNLIEDNENLYLIKITLKKSFFDKFENDDQIYYFYNFIKHVLLSRKRIIPYFEAVNPNCGPKLILMGYTIYTKFVDLKPEEFLRLFLEVSKWPEFNFTAFSAHLKNERKKLNSDELNPHITRIPDSVVSSKDSNRYNSLLECEDHDDYIDEDNEIDDTFLPKSE